MENPNVIPEGEPSNFVETTRPGPNQRQFISEDFEHLAVLNNFRLVQWVSYPELRNSNNLPRNPESDLENSATAMASLRNPESDLEDSAITMPSLRNPENESESDAVVIVRGTSNQGNYVFGNESSFRNSSVLRCFAIWKSYINIPKFSNGFCFTIYSILKHVKDDTRKMFGLLLQVFCWS